MRRQTVAAVDGPGGAHRFRRRRASSKQERMSVNSISSGLLPFYAPFAGNNSQRPKFPALPEPSQQTTTAGTDESLSADGVGQAESSLAQALRAERAAAGRSSSGGPGSAGGRSAGGAALYKLVSRIGQNEISRTQSRMGGGDPSAAALLRNWSSIMETGQVGSEAGGTAGLQPFQQQDATFFQNEPSMFESSSFHVTA
jgi:hypothetical protein